ncbi:hypothetical protein AWH63_10670 [Marinobacter sp. C18]|uniref:hypothetical protein n=1 Tax=Marinobacter sp. C18 TaxID=1772288 RepID=UPI000948D1A9|nr:hypothetical protein [Marinobacter sp. C18]OLF81994.1 hypothetical protein AWH63_10670 [Marinobacter sp. C18]
MSNQGSESVQDNQSTEANGSNQSQGRLRRIGGKVGKVVYKTSALDVLIKDSKRIKPRFPSLWKDIIGGKWRDVDKTTTKQPVRVASITALICGILTIAFAGFSVVIIANAGRDGSVPSATIIGCSLVTFAGLIQTFCYGYVAFKQRVRGTQINKAKRATGSGDT